ncbi:52 kDa repressor of the inhibitor of the protein kinase-like [Montipora foliosa]|uniref:52 kDa repressor of the inhibitor of the protein kinase-like n=1 Tax=Montipora foliosa TaxID=591990 RepID=UPI0035F146B9
MLTGNVYTTIWKLLSLQTAVFFIENSPEDSQESTGHLPKVPKEKKWKPPPSRKHSVDSNAQQSCKIDPCNVDIPNGDQTGDKPVIDSYYHISCLTALYNRLRSIPPKEEENITTQVLLEAFAVAELVAYIGDNAKQTVFKLSDLSKLYSCRLEQLGAYVPEQVTSTRLKERLLSQLPDLPALAQHIKRAAYQAGHVWGQTLEPMQELPGPAEWGWQQSLEANDLFFSVETRARDEDGERENADRLSGLEEVVSNDSPAAKRPRSSVESQSSPEIEDTTTDADSSILLKNSTEHVNDLGLYYTKAQSLSDDRKLELLKNFWTPPRAYNFPKTQFYGKNRAFSFEWLTQFPWLVYSAAQDGAFCRFCVLFGHLTGKNSDRLDKLYKSPIKNWVSASTKFKEHQLNSEFHKAAAGCAEDFLRVQEGKMLSISEQLSDIHRNTVELNRQKLRSIIKTVVLCGKQNMALRGHRDDSSHLDESSGNPGNFQALLNFRVEAGDKVLANHFANGPRNATYRSKTIQNEIIEVLGTYIQDKIVAEINEAGAFSLLADEASDSSNKEQLPLVLRFVDKERNVREEFVGFYECEDGITGQAIATLIIKAVQELGLSMDFCKGQCYDGAGNMSGPCNGAAAIVRRQYPKAIYIHCMAHRLNLSVVSACKMQNVRNMFDTVGEVTRSFEYTPKKEALLVQIVKDVCPESRRHKLLDVCKTLWIQRIDGLEVFLELYEAIVATLETIKANADRSWNADSTKKAVSHYHAIANFDFVVTLTVCQAVLAFTKGLTVKMQGTSTDILGVFSDIKDVVKTLSSLRQKVEEKHAKLFQKACQIAEKLDITVQKPRTCQVQRNRANNPAETVEDHYRRNLTIPLVDHLINELETRFGSGDQETAVQCLFAVPSMLLASKKKWRTSFARFSTFHEDSLPSPLSLDAEMTLWQRKWERRDPSTVPATVAATLKEIDSGMYPNITECFKIFSTLPVTTCACERNVSALRRLKTYLRSTMSQTRLTGIALLHIHYNMDINFDEIIRRFARLHPRRMQLANILSD